MKNRRDIGLRSAVEELLTALDEDIFYDASFDSEAENKAGGSKATKAVIVATAKMDKVRSLLDD